jgi:hypothetical protein
MQQDTATRRTTSGRQRKGRGLVRLKTLAALDTRTHAARKAFSIMGSLLSDLGGVENTSTAEQQLVQRASVLAARIEDAEARWIEGEEIDVSEHLAAVNCQRRVLEVLGLRRRHRDVTPHPLDYAKDFAARRKAAEETTS